MDTNRIEFLASIPHRKGAVRFDGEDGGDVVFEVPGTHDDALTVLKHMRNKVLRVTVEVAE